MNKKKLLAFLAAATMLLGTVPVSAAATDSATVVTSAGTTTATSDATINDVDKSDRLVVTLPTGKALNFIVDPHNLVGLASGSSVVLDKNATGAGAILAADDALAVIKNQSNVDVKVDVNLTVVASGASTLTLATNQAGAIDATKQAMFLVAVPSTVRSYDETTYTATNQGIAVQSSGTSFAFKLGAAEYEVVNNGGTFTYQLKADEDNFDATSFKLGGAVNKAADWNSVDSLQVVAKYTIGAADSTVQVASGSGIYGLVSGAAVVDYTPVAGAKVSAVANFSGFGGSQTFFWLAASATEGFETCTTVKDVKVNGVSCPNFSISEDNCVILQLADVAAIGQNEEGMTSWTIEANIDGTVYTGTYSVN